MSDRESFGERKFRKYVEDDGGECVKMAQKKGWPDRIILPANCPMGIIWIEFKKKGLKAAKIQAHVHKRLKELGHAVFVADSYEQAIQVYEEYKRIYNARLHGSVDQVPIKESSSRVISRTRIGQDNDSIVSVQDTEEEKNS